MATEDIIESLENLHKQSTEERSHFYVAHVVKEACGEITKLKMQSAIMTNALAAIARWDRNDFPRDNGVVGEIEHVRTLARNALTQ